MTFVRKDKLLLDAQGRANGGTHLKRQTQAPHMEKSGSSSSLLRLTLSVFAAYLLRERRIGLGLVRVKVNFI